MSPSSRGLTFTVNHDPDSLVFVTKDALQINQLIADYRAIAAAKADTTKHAQERATSSNQDTTALPRPLPNQTPPSTSPKHVTRATEKNSSGASLTSPLHRVRRSRKSQPSRRNDVSARVSHATSLDSDVFHSSSSLQTLEPEVTTDGMTSYFQENFC